jgi:hypothetical protein
VEPASVERAAVAPARRTARSGLADAQRRRLTELVEVLPARELETALTFLEFLRERRPLPRVHHEQPREYRRESNEGALDDERDAEHSRGEHSRGV